MQVTKQRVRQHKRGGAVLLSFALTLMFGLAGYFGTTMLMTGRGPADVLGLGDAVPAAGLPADSDGGRVDGTPPPDSGEDSGSGAAPAADPAAGLLDGNFWFGRGVTTGLLFHGVKFDGDQATFYINGKVIRTTYTITEWPAEDKDGRIVFVPEDPSVTSISMDGWTGFPLDTTLGIGTNFKPNDINEALSLGTALFKPESQLNPPQGMEIPEIP